MTQQAAHGYLRHGLTPFFRLPAVMPLDHRGPAVDSPSYDGADAVLLGVPHDAGTTYQPGARFAPFHVRRVSALVQGHHLEHGCDVFHRISALDGGNVAFPPFDREIMRAAVEGEVARVVAAGAAPFVVGGDHSVALPALRAVARKHGPLAVVHVDAHLDLSGPETWGDEFHHGTPLRHAIKEGLIAQGQLHQLGIRGPWGTAEDAALARSIGGTLVTAPEFDARGVPAIMAELREKIGERPVYLTFDIDGVDPSFAPGTGTPVPGGLTSREALALVRGLAGTRLVGMDLVEVAPALDHADLTVNLAAYLLFEGLAVLAMSPERQ
ncbi:MAG: agmatinase [Kofleriaceae bacterium]